MNKAALIIAMLALASCNQRTGADAYRFEQKEFEHDAPTIRFVTHGSLEELRNAAPASAHVEGRDLMAWSILSGPGYSECEVHIVDPTVVYTPEWIGHEIAHCVYGRWHA